MATSTDIGLDIKRVTGALGAEISGVDATAPLNDETIAVIRQALLDHKVVFLRDQELDY